MLVKRERYSILPISIYRFIPLDPLDSLKRLENINLCFDIIENRCRSVGL